MAADEVYRKLNRLCDILDGKFQVLHDPNPHRLMIRESNELLAGLRKLHADSDSNEQVRLMTIAPTDKKLKNGAYSILISFDIYVYF